MVSRAMIFAPIAAWMATSYICFGMTSLSFWHLAAALVGALAVDDDAERVHRLAVDEDVELHEVASS